MQFKNARQMIVAHVHEKASDSLEVVPWIAIDGV